MNRNEPKSPTWLLLLIIGALFVGVLLEAWKLIQ